jgi:tetratricopeptide (TPR) repeat protein
MTTHSDSQSQKLFENSSVGGNVNIKTLLQIIINLVGNNNNEVNLSEQDDEIPHRDLLLDYRLKAEKFICASYVRSGCIDPDCEDSLEEARKTLDLSPKQTISIENEIIQNCLDANLKLEKKIERYQHQISKIIDKKQDKSFFSDKDRDILKEKQEAIGIEIQPAAVAFSKLGRNLIKEEELEKAYAYFQESIHLNVDDPSAYVNIETILCKQGYFKEALVVLNFAEWLYQFHHPKLKEQHQRLKLIIEHISTKRKRQNILANFIEKFLR